MQHIAQQLEQVRRRGRALLVFQRLAQGLSVAVVALLSLGFVDFGLRLPGWMRGLIALSLLVVGVSWLARRLARAWRFGPGLSDLALRVERMYPQLGGLLTSALEFSLHPQRYAQPAATAALAARSVEDAQSRLEHVEVRRLIDPVPSRRRGLQLLVSLAVFSMMVAVAPTHSAIAATRWLMPWSDAAWPKRTELVPQSLAAVRPIDSPLEFTTRVARGHRPAMRVWLKTRLILPGEERPAASEAVLMTEQVGFAAQALLDDAQQAPPACLLYTSPSPRDQRGSRMPSSA